MDSNLISFTWIFVLVSTMQIEGVTVNPHPCPTNKIAPHRRILTGNVGSPRTFAAYYDLLAPSFNQQYAPSNGLLEEPQKDDPEDCGDIEDYDESDLSSLSSPLNQRRGHSDRRFLFGIFRPPPPAPSPPKPVSVPQPVPVPQPARPPNYPPARPPYWSGGHFSNNPYRPPAHHYPSDSIKPVYEAGTNERPEIYRPDMVGGLWWMVMVGGHSNTWLECPRLPYDLHPTDTQPSPPNEHPATTSIPRECHRAPTVTPRDDHGPDPGD